MLSILIPTYNYNCSHLVCELQKQCEEVQAMLGKDFNYEIILADDASVDMDCVQANAVVECLPNCRYEEQAENIGRARIRNWLISLAKYDWLLFMDCDAEVISDDYILNYWKATEKSLGDIIVGGITTPKEALVGCELRHRYELAAENIRTLKARQAEPAAFFSTFNFLMHKRVLEKVLFDERCLKYGYEDALFGIEAEQCGFKIIHIDNPLMHMGINDNASFLANSEMALRSLFLLGSPMTDRARVAKAASKMRSLHLPGLKKPSAATLLYILYRICSPLIRQNLLSHHPNLALFSFYKLGYYLGLKKLL